MLSAILGYYVLLKGITDIKLNFKGFSFDQPLLIKAFKIGGPSSIEISARALGLTLMTGIAAKFGTDVLAAYGVGSRLISFVVIFGLGLLRASSTIVGQNMGAGQIERAEKGATYAAWIGFIGLSIIGVLFYVFATPLVKAFMDAEERVVQMGVDFLKIVSLSFGFMGAQLALVGTLRGSGNTVESMILTIIGIWIIQFPFAWITSSMDSFKETGVWWSFPVSYVIPCILTIFWFKRGKWKEKKLVD
jgi:Na+-driven multidrug efflux pump